MGQELLTTFEGDIKEISFLPSTGGVFDISINDQLIFSRKKEERFPDIKELKQLVRDIINPSKSLGHSDKKSLD